VALEWIDSLERVDWEELSLLYQVAPLGHKLPADLATAFSNDDNSHMSSVGLFVTRDVYVGHNGYSLRLDGLVIGAP